MKHPLRHAASVLSLAAAVLLGGAVFGDGADHVVIASAELRAQPLEGSASRGRLAEGTRVERRQRTGGWVRVREAGGGREGWLRLWQVRAAESGGENPLLSGLKRFSRQIAGLFRAGGDRGLQEQPVTATIGVRGLDAGDFEQAAPDPAALRAVRSLRPAPGEAAAFARQGGLQRRQVATLETPQSRDWGEW